MEAHLVEDELNVPHRVVDALTTPQLTFDQLDVALELAEVRAIARGEIVEDANSISPLQQCATRCDLMKPAPPVTRVL